MDERMKEGIAELHEHEPTVAAETGQGHDGLLKIGELAHRTGKSVRALHLYEEMGLLTPTGRTTGRFRLYGEDAALRVEWIGKLQELGFTLPQIQQVLGEVHSGTCGDTAMARVGQLLRIKLTETRETIHRLKVLEKELEESLAYLDNCRGCSDTSLPEACRMCGRPRPEERPGLVRGLQIV